MTLGNDEWWTLKLDSYDVRVDLMGEKDAIEDLFRTKKVDYRMIDNNQIAIRSRLFALDIDFYLSFVFAREKITRIIISPCVSLEGKALCSRYNKIQKALISRYGFPSNRIGAIINLLDRDNSYSRWKNKGVEIEHYLVDRFGAEETIKIQLSGIV